MRVLILVDCYLPSCKSSAKLIYDLASEFQRRGHETTVLTVASGIERAFEVSIEDGLRVARVRTGQIKGAPRAFRALREARLSSLVWRAAGKFLRENPCDLIVFYSPTIFWGRLVRRLKALWKCPVYLILRDIFPQWALDAGLLSRGWVYRFFRRKELQQYGCADVIAVQSSGDLKHFARDSVRSTQRLEVLYNWASHEEANLPRTQFRAQLGLQGKIVFFYGGTLGRAQDVDNIVRLASGLEDHAEIRFLLVGGGSEAHRLQDILRTRNVGNVLLLPPVDQREYLAMVSEFDVGLISLDRRLTTNNIPGKLLGYLYWGLPVLGSVNSGNELLELIQKENVGLCVENGKDECFRNAALLLAGNAPLRAQMGANGRALLLRKFSASGAMEQILLSVSTVDRFESRGFVSVRDSRSSIERW